VKFNKSNTVTNTRHLFFANLIVFACLLTYWSCHKLVPKTSHCRVGR